MTEYERGFIDGIKSKVSAELTPTLINVSKTMLEMLKPVLSTALENALNDNNAITDTDVQPVDTWTSIEESKPKDMQQVLAVVDGEVREAFYNTGCFIGSNFYRSINEVKWWQPLPEPPKDGEHND